VALGAAAALSLTFTGMLSMSRIIAERDRAEQSRDVARAERTVARRQRNRVILSQARSTLATDPTQAIAWLKTYPADGDDWDQVADIAARASGLGVASRVMRAHGGVVVRAQFSPSGRHVASSSNDGTLRLWHLDRAETRVVSARPGARRLFAFSADGQRIYYDTEDGQLMRYHIEEHRNESIGRVTSAITAIVIGQDGNSLLVGDNGGVVTRWTLHPPVSRQSLARLSAPIVSLAVSPGGEELAICDARGRLYRLGTSGKQPEPAGSCSAGLGTSHISYSADGRFLAVPAYGASVLLVDRSRRKHFILRGHAKKITHVEFAPASSLLASSSRDGTTRLWDADTGAFLYLLRHATAANGASFSPSGRLIADSCEDGTVLLHDLITRATVTLKAATAGVALRPTFAPDGTQLLTADGNHALRLWAVRRPWPQVFVGHDDSIPHLAATPDGSTIVTDSVDKTLRVWNGCRSSYRL
jgi:WD40 repeat protein